MSVDLAWFPNYGHFVAAIFKAGVGLSFAINSKGLVGTGQAL